MVSTQVGKIRVFLISVYVWNIFFDILYIFAQ